MDNLIDILESILLQDDRVNLSMAELHVSLNTIDDIIRLGHSLKNSILNIMANNYKDEFLENEIYYNTIYMSKLIDTSTILNVSAFKSNKKAIIQPPLIEKIGGYPTLKRGEKWPIVNGEHLTFIAQFKLPNSQNNILYRVFANIDDRMTNYYILSPLVIKDTNKYLKNIKLSFPDSKTIKEYTIKEWNQCKELKQFNNVCDIYRERISNIECEQAFEYAYDLAINTKQDISTNNDEIQLGISICENIMNEKKLMFTIPAELIRKNIESNQSHDSGIYYFYEDESMQFL